MGRRYSKSLNGQMEHVTSELRGSLVFNDEEFKRVEELVVNTRDDGQTWMHYCQDIRNHFTGVDNEREKGLHGWEPDYQSKVVVHELLIKKMAKRMDK